MMTDTEVAAQIEQTDRFIAGVRRDHAETGVFSGRKGR